MTPQNHPLDFLKTQANVLAKWRRTLFLRDQKNGPAKGWLLSVMKCIEKIQQPTFTLEEMYSFENELRMTYPSNRHIKEKLRQQLQILRDKGYLDFIGKGAYRLVPPSVQ